MDTKFTRYYCSPEWHLAQLTSTPFAAILYSFALRIAKSGRFHGSVMELTEYFGVSRWKVQRAIPKLLSLGFFELIAREPFQPSSYRVLSHKEWAIKHPGRCTTKEAFPWSGEEGDPLGVALWNASGGKVQYKPFQLKALRNTGLTDEQIVGAFERIVNAEEERRRTKDWHGRWSAVQRRFSKWLTGQIGPAELERLGLEPFSRPSEPLRESDGIDPLVSGVDASQAA